MLLSYLFPFIISLKYFKKAIVHALVPVYLFPAINKINFLLLKGFFIFTITPVSSVRYFLLDKLETIFQLLSLSNLIGNLLFILAVIVLTTGPPISIRLFSR